MRIRIKFQKQMKLEQLLFYVGFFCVSSFALLEHASISLWWMSVIKWPLLILGAVCVISQLNMVVRTFLKKKYFYVWLALLLFCATMLLSAYVNRDPDIGVNPMRNTLRTILFLIELYILMIWAAEMQRGQGVLRFLFRYVLILCIATDFLLITRLRVFYSGQYESYLVGTKFTVSYLHMNLLVLWSMQDNRRIQFRHYAKLRLLALAIIPLIVTIRVECVTGAIGCVVLFFMMFIMDSTKKKKMHRVFSPVNLSVMLGISLIFPFVSELVMSIPFVRVFIVSILNKSENLTGRTNIFNIFGEQMQDHWLWGYGLGNGNAAAVEMFDYANAQNAQLQWILQGGLVTMLAMTLLMLIVFNQTRKSGKATRVLPLGMLVYAYIILGMVEITFSMSFLMWIAVIFMLVNEKTNAAPLPASEGSVKGATL